MLVVPEGCAHGFQTLQKDCEIMYLVSKAYNPKSEREWYGMIQILKLNGH